MKNYGLTTFQREAALKKLYRNIEYMHENGITMDGNFVPYADFVQNSYNNADRYIAEIQHRAWSMFDYARENDLENLMFTLTLPTEWHPMKRKNPKSKTDKTMVFNQKFGGRKYITKINGYKFLNCLVKQDIPFVEPVLDFSPMDRYSPRNASKMLSKMLARFFKDRSYTSISKEFRCYFRVTEPHTDGTPHVHMSLFVPSDKKERIVKALTRLYPAPLGQIETDIKKPVHYLMKYVLKTFDDLRDENKEVSNLTLWYLHHGISRFYTSRTFVSLDVYRKLKGVYGLKELSEAYLRGDVRVYTYKDSNDISLIENEYGTLYTPKPINLDDKEEHTYYEGEFKPIYKEKKPKLIPVDIDGEDYLLSQGELIKVKKQPHEMSSMELWLYYESLDIDTVNLHHYYYVHNLLIDRGLLAEEKIPLISALEVEEF